MAAFEETVTSLSIGGGDGEEDGMLGMLGMRRATDLMQRIVSDQKEKYTMGVVTVGFSTSPATAGSFAITCCSVKFPMAETTLLQLFDLVLLQLCCRENTKLRAGGGWWGGD